MQINCLAHPERTQTLRSCPTEHRICCQTNFEAGISLKIHEKIQKSIERLFFKGKSTKLSVYVTYAIGNIALMLVVFYVLLNNIAYDWTGQLYPVGSGYNLSFLFGGLDNAVPFVP